MRAQVEVHNVWGLDAAMLSSSCTTSRDGQGGVNSGLGGSLQGTTPKAVAGLSVVEPTISKVLVDPVDKARGAVRCLFK